MSVIRIVLNLINEWFQYTKEKNKGGKESHEKFIIYYKDEMSFKGYKSINVYILIFISSSFIASIR